jgi:acetylornithine deacetylase/succinyl-diaminopimelate desuccinylase-like protein
MNEYPDYLDELLEFLRIPSVSTLPEHGGDMIRAAGWVEAAIRKAGIDLVETHVVDGGHPLVFAERVDDPANPTVLLYGHYDVQPVDPPDEWKSPPFSPEIRDGAVYARGSSDDKGQLCTHLFALRELSARWGDNWPVNIRIIAEGEEEAGGASIEKWAAENREKLAADFAVISDTAFLKRDTPSIDYGLRGIVYMEIEVTGPGRDLHSGVYGGGVMNPGSALAKILDSLIDLETGRVLIPGFYDDVEAITETDRRLAAEVPFDEREFVDQAGSKTCWGEKGYSTYERVTSRPTLDINGMTCGFQGEGAKTVLPRRASAKVSMRIVPHQNPDNIASMFCEHVHAVAPPQVTVECRKLHAASGVLLNPESAHISAARDVMEEVFGARPVLIRSGASIPIATIFNVELGMDVVFLGFGMPDDALHSPNEKFEIAQFYKGIEAVMKLLERVANSISNVQ